MGKPIIMTRSGCLDVDLDELGIGRYVPPGDVDAWVDEISSLLGGKTYNTDSFLRAREQFSPVNFSQKLNDFLARL